jgi:putative ABC transport system permease protein
MMQWMILAARNVARHSRRSLLLGGTIAVGALALLLFISYITASLLGLRESTIRGGMGHAQLATAAQADGYAEQQLQFGIAAKERAQLEARLEQEPGLRRIAPRLSFGGLVSNGARTLNFEGGGVDPLRERQAFGAFQNIVAGKPLGNGEEERYKVLLGQELARRLAVQPGGSVTLLTTTVSGSVNAMDLEVAGLVSTGVPEKDLYLLELPLETAQELLRTDKISSLALLYEDTAQAPAISARLQQRLGQHYQLKTWQQLAPLYEQVLQLFRNQFLIFCAIICLVIFLGVATMTLTTIYERAAEIGTLRSMGISQVQIRRLFVYEGLLQGLGGAIAGGTLAWVAAVLVNAARIELAPPPGRSSGVLLQMAWVPEYAALIICLLPLVAVLAAWFTSRRIGRMQIRASLSLG